MRGRLCNRRRYKDMSKDYTQFDWASDRLARMSWDEDEFLAKIDRRMSKRSKRAKSNKKNHRNYA